jgi:4a-hydroxytetrahydrobiopterin dehydratase
MYMKLLTVTELAKEVPTWTFTGKALEKSYEFSDFKQAFAFMTQIAFYAEVQDHHPEWTNCYQQVHIKLSTHTHHGVTNKDVALAKVIDQVFGQH